MGEWNERGWTKGREGKREDEREGGKREKKGRETRIGSGITQHIGDLAVQVDKLLCMYKVLLSEEGVYVSAVTMTTVVSETH